MRVLLGGARPDPGALLLDDTSEWPFRRGAISPPPAAPAAIHIRNLHLAFPSGQRAGTRLVLTQSTYQLQRWLDWAAAHPGTAVTADADEQALRRSAPEAFAKRGPWSRIEILTRPDGDAVTGDRTASELHAAFVQPDPELRRRACLRAVEEDPAEPALLLALGSSAMEIQDVQAALDADEAAVALALDWEAAYFELGKVWLRADDTARAAAAFGEAARLMPSFATAWSNFGAALGELERRDDAIAALRRALEYDPYGHPTLNNLGVALRDLGDLAGAEATFRQVVHIAPAFVFGRYNLAQTLLLARRYDEALAAYEDASASDPERSPRQASRLAVARAAAGDGAGGVTAMQEAIAGLTGEPRLQALEEAERWLSGMAGAVPGNENAVKRVLRMVREHAGRS
jgi:tetratricopeptide (TPR) repeat protein